MAIRNGNRITFTGKPYFLLQQSPGGVFYAIRQLVPGDDGEWNTVTDKRVGRKGVLTLDRDIERVRLEPNFTLVLKFSDPRSQTPDLVRLCRQFAGFAGHDYVSLGCPGDFPQYLEESENPVRYRVEFVPSLFRRKKL